MVLVESGLCHLVVLCSWVQLLWAMVPTFIKWGCHQLSQGKYSSLNPGLPNSMELHTPNHTEQSSSKQSYGGLIQPFWVAVFICLENSNFIYPNQKSKIRKQKEKQKWYKLHFFLTKWVFLTNTHAHTHTPAAWNCTHLHSKSLHMRLPQTRHCCFSCTLF